MAQIFLRLDRRGAAGARRGDRLLVNAVGDVAGNENAGMFALGQMPGDQITVRIGLEFPCERLRVRIVADRDKDARHRQLAFLVRLHVAQARPRVISPFSSGMYFVTTVFQIGSIFSQARTRSAMIFDARNLSRR